MPQSISNPIQSIPRLGFPFRRSPAANQSIHNSMHPTSQQDDPESPVRAADTITPNGQPATRLCQLVMATAFLFQAGCGGTTPSSLATSKLAAPVYELADAASQPKRFHGLFV